MAIFSNDVDFTKLIQLTNGTLQVASFVQIRNALIQRFKDIYGNDIDVSAASADGQYINSIALLINNTLQTIKQGYEQLDPASATGQYLDTLCSFNNINRITESQSIAQLYVYNHTNSDLTFDKLTFIDKNNTLWIWDNGGEQVTFLKGRYTLITDVECEEYGAVTAPGANSFYDADGHASSNPEDQDWTNPDYYTDFNMNGSIYQCVANNGLWVWQYSDAEVGNEYETDEALRSRRYQMLGNNSVTVLESLKGNLLNIDGIKDVYIFNNFLNTTFTLNTEPVGDLTVVPAHTVYVAIRYKEGVEIDPAIIGKIIYNKLTPGIGTAQTTDPNDQEQYEIIRSGGISNYVYWKKCPSNSPHIVLNFYTNPKLYDFPLSGGVIHTAAHNAESDVEKRMVAALQKMINEVKIDEFLTVSNLLTIVQQCDLQKDGMATLFAQNGSINTTLLQLGANLEYFLYDDSDYDFTYDTVNNIGTITIG